MMTPPALLPVSRKLINSTKRHWVEKRLEGKTRLHLACGGHVLDEWANIDLDSKGDVIGWNLTNRLPVRSDTIELIYCEHFIEHITLKQATVLLADCYRVLRSGGILRFSTPNLMKLVDEYLSGRTSEWCDVGWSPSTPCQMVNEGLHLWGHQFVYDADELKRILEEAGYRKVTQVDWHESKTPALRNLERRPFHDEIIFEAIK
jgi:predicted SAM-dependent methyltransferase